MLKIYSWLANLLEAAEFSVQKKIKQRLDRGQFGVFSPGLILLSFELFILELFLSLARFFIVIFLDSGKGFNTVFRQQELHSCPYSYSTYKDKQRKLRTFSSGTLATMVIAVGIVSLVMNLLFSDKLTGWAQTFSWQQTSWSSGASSTAVATHASNQTNWTRFSSGTANIATSTNGITLNQTAVVAANHTTDIDFNAGTKSAYAYVSGSGAGASIKLLKPFGASCVANSECTDGAGGVLGGWCDAGSGNVCHNPWIGAVCTSSLDNPGSILKVMRSDISASTYQWNSSFIDCNTPYCGQDGGQDGDNLVASNVPNFSAAGFAARAACAIVGARLPTKAELACIIANKTSYSAGGAFQAASYWSSTEVNSSQAWLIMSNGIPGNWGKTSSYYVRCVKGQ